MAMWMAAIVAPIQIGMGDLHGLNTLEHQPMKIAAMEGDWEPSGADGAPLILFGLPNMAEERTDYKIEIPHLSSLILTHTWNGRVPGLKEVPAADRPYAPAVFWTFRTMVGIGFLMFGLGLPQPLGTVARHAVHQQVAPEGGVGHVAGADRGDAVRVDDDGDRSATLHSVWRAADSRQRVAYRIAGDRDLAGGVRGGVLHRVRRGCDGDPADDGTTAAPGRARTGPQSADPISGYTSGVARGGAARHWRDPHGSGGVSAMSAETIAVIWAGLIAFAVLAYVVLDGFDLGVGILFAAERGAEDRDTMVNTIAPMWDGNETWLVLGGGGLFGVFPLAYAVILPALVPHHPGHVVRADLPRRRL